MALGPMRQNDTAPVGTITCQTMIGRIVDLTPYIAANLTVQIKNLATGIEVTGTGTITILAPASAGMIQYAWSAGDSATPGNYNVYVVIQTANGPMTCLPMPWQVLPL